MLTIGEQLKEVLQRHLKLKDREALAKAHDLLAMVQIADPGARLRSYAHQLSGGQRQRVMIAMALACPTQLLIADEPTTALDVTVQADILALLGEQKRQRQLAMLLVTHDFGVVAQVADRVLVMYAGRKIEEGPVRQVLADPVTPTPNACYGLDLAHGKTVCSASLRYLVWFLHLRIAVPAVHLHPGVIRCNRSADCACPTLPTTDEGIKVPAWLTMREPLLQIDNVRFAYAGQGATKPTVDGVTLIVRPGETLGLVGESGCGKSTLARIAVGLLRADQGSVRVSGADVAAPGSAARLARARRVQMVFQDPHGS